MADMFSTDVLIRTVNSMKMAPSFLLDRFFPNIQTEESEEIHFDVQNRTRRIAPFVSPLVAGKVVAAEGYTTNTFKPAYIKPKTPFDPRRPLRRAMGEQIGGNLAPQDRLRLNLALTLEDHIDMINRRLEVMAAEALRLGRVTVSGESHPTEVVSFGRDGGHTIVKGAGSKWGDAGVKPLDDLQNWAQQVLKTEGAQPVDVVMDVDSWKVFRADADVDKRLDNRRVMDNAMSLDAQMHEGGVYMGTVDGFNVWVYSGWYIDDDDVEQPILPSGTVILSSAQLEGVRAFGAIQDHDAGLVALPYYPKSWVTPDPSQRWLMTQSAPLVVPTRVNASLSASVL